MSSSFIIATFSAKFNKVLIALGKKIKGRFLVPSYFAGVAGAFLVSIGITYLLATTTPPITSTSVVAIFIRFSFENMIFSLKVRQIFYLIKSKIIPFFTNKISKVLYRSV